MEKIAASGLAMSNFNWKILSEDDEMLKYRLKLEKLKERFDAAIISNTIILIMVFLIYVTNFRGDTTLTPFFGCRYADNLSSYINNRLCKKAADNLSDSWWILFDFNNSNTFNAYNFRLEHRVLFFNKKHNPA